MNKMPKNLKRALAHQKRLSVLKFLIIGGAVLAAVLIIVVPYCFDHKNSVLQENKKNEDQKNITEKQILEPHFEGIDEKNQPYHIKAQYATQVSEEQVDLTSPEGELTLASGEKINIRANEGVLTGQNKYLDLKGDVKLDYVDCSVITNEAHADLETKMVQGGKVRSFCPEGVINAGGFTVDQERGIVTYKDRPHLILQGKSNGLSSQ